MIDIRRWQRAWRKRFAIPVRSRLAPEVVVKVRGELMCVDLRDYPIGQTLYLDGNFEPELERLMQHMDLVGSVCLDIGANIGLHTLTMSKLVGSSGRVFAFEPEADNFRLLRENVRLNASNNVTLLQYVVSDREGTCQIALNPDNYGDHRVAAAAPPDWQRQEAPMTTVDDAINGLPDGAIRFIKIDVQGHEPRVFDGMEETLERNPDVIIAVEIAPDLLVNADCSASKLMARLASLGFTGWELLEHRIIPIGEPWIYDLIKDSQWVNVVVSRNAQELKNVMSSYCGVELPSIPVAASN